MVSYGCLIKRQPTKGRFARWQKVKTNAVFLWIENWQHVAPVQGGSARHRQSFVDKFVKCCSYQPNSAWGGGNMEELAMSNDLPSPPQVTIDKIKPSNGCYCKSWSSLCTLIPEECQLFAKNVRTISRLVQQWSGVRPAAEESMTANR